MLTTSMPAAAARALAVVAVSVALAAAAAQASAPHTPTCGFRDEATGATFDVEGLTRPVHSPYVAADLDARGYDYFWNFCGLVAEPEEYCVGSSPAWQVWANGSQCYALGSATLSDSDVVWKLLEEDDPTAGVSITYKNGEPCTPVGGDPIKRSFTVNLLCKDEEDVPDLAAVEETCHYTVEYKSVLACPLECPVGEVNRRLCSGHGLCEMDRVAGRPRCLCNTGYFGTDCSSRGSTVTSSGCDGTCGAMIFLMIILIIFIVLLFGAWYNTVKNHSGFIGGAPSLRHSLVDRDSSEPVHESPAAVAGSPRRYGHAGGDHEVELNLDDDER